MTYFVHRNGITRKKWLSLLNWFLVIFIPIGTYQNKKFINSNSYWKCLKEEIEIWKEGFNFGD